MLAAFIDGLLHLAEICGSLLSRLRDDRLIALGEHRAKEKIFTRLNDALRRVKAIDAKITTIHRRHADDSAFDTTFERKDDA
jgi:hypothetical protein